MYKSFLIKIQLFLKFLIFQRFLSNLCKLGKLEAVDKNEKLIEKCPRGLDLIFYLFDVSKYCSSNTTVYSLVLYLFKMTLKPFFR